MDVPTLLSRFKIFEQGFKEALEYGGNTHTVDELFSLILDGRAHLWVGDDCAAVTEIISYPRFHSLRFWLATGDLEGLIKLEEQISDWAGRNNIKRVEFAGGRPGFSRVLKNKGYRTLCPVSVKEL